MGDLLEKEVQLHERDDQGRDWLVYPMVRNPVSYPVAIDKGGTGATNAATALSNLGAAASGHTHSPESIGASPSNHTHTPVSIGAAAASHTHILTDLNGTLTVAKGGTGATDATGARTNLGVTLANLGAASASHTHTLSDLGGTLSVAKGGTGATDAPTARNNLGVTLTNLGAAALGHSHALTDSTITGVLGTVKGGTGVTSLTDFLTSLVTLGVLSSNIIQFRRGSVATSSAGTTISFSPEFPSDFEVFVLGMPHAGTPTPWSVTSVTTSSALLKTGSSISSCGWLAIGIKSSLFG